MSTHVPAIDDATYEEVRGHRLLGFLLFLISDSILFSSFIFGYLYIRSASPGWPPPGVERPDLYLAAVNSIVLFGSGVTMHLAMEGWRHADRRRFVGFIIATIILGIGFLSGQAYEYMHLHDTWAGSTFGATFFTLTGMRGVYTQTRFFGLTAATLYWHFVDVIWVALFFLFYVY